MVKDTLKEIVNDYGNAVVEITLDFIKGHYTEEARDKAFMEAGNILVSKIKALIEQTRKEEREKIHNAIAYHFGDEKCDEFIKLMENK